jgi:hypothetical protein
MKNPQNNVKVIVQWLNMCYFWRFNANIQQLNIGVSDSLIFLKTLMSNA